MIGREGRDLRWSGRTEEMELSQSEESVEAVAGGGDLGTEDRGELSQLTLRGLERGIAGFFGEGIVGRMGRGLLCVGVVGAVAG